MKLVAIVLIADPNESFAKELGRDFCRFGYRACILKDIGDLSPVRTAAADLVVSERSFSGGPWEHLLTAAKAAKSSAEFVVLTATPSVAEARTALERGVSAYMAKPATAANVLDAVAGIQSGLAIPAEDRYATLEKAKWDYIQQTLASAGSIAEAARRLRIERRSLRRMLAKNPPPR
jgi:two-component system response regulator RegA